MLAENYRQGTKDFAQNFVGLVSMKEAMNKGLTVAESVGRVKTRFHWMAKSLSLIFTARIYFDAGI